jgi:hypothetical protein
MKYYRDWWLLATLWSGLCLNSIVIALTTSWAHPNAMQFFAQLIGVVLMAFFLAICLIPLYTTRIDGLEKLPTAEEREMVKAHEALSRQFNLLEQEELLLSRRQDLSKRRDAYVQKLEKESGLR